MTKRKRMMVCKGVRNRSICVGCYNKKPHLKDEDCGYCSVSPKGCRSCEPVVPVTKRKVTNVSMSDKCSKHVFPEIEEDCPVCKTCKGTRRIQSNHSAVTGPCPTCNPLKSEGPSLEANENGVGVMVNGRCLIFVASSLKNPAQHAQAYFQVAKDAYDEGRASLIPLVRELLDGMDEYYRTQDEKGIGIFNRAKKEIEK